MKLRSIFFQTSDTFANVYATPAELLDQIELLKQKNANLREWLSKQNISVAEILETTAQAYTEQNLRWHLPEKIPFDLTTQWTMRSGLKNDFHLLQFDFQGGYQW